MDRKDELIIMIGDMFRSADYVRMSNVFKLADLIISLEEKVESLENHHHTQFGYSKPVCPEEGK